MYTLIVDCNGFILEHCAYIIDVCGKTVGFMHLPASEIATFVINDKRINEVKLSGGIEYCTGLKEEIENKIATEYGNDRKIKVEVM